MKDRNSVYPYGNIHQRPVMELFEIVYESMGQDFTHTDPIKKVMRELDGIVPCWRSAFDKAMDRILLRSLVVGRSSPR